MTTWKTKSVVELDPAWVDAILVTAFDGDYGACWYWVNEDEEITKLGFLPSKVDDPVLEGRKYLDGVTFWLLRGVPVVSHQRRFAPNVHLGDPGNGKPTPHVSITGRNLSAACGKALDVHGHTETARQLRRSLTENDCDLDAEAADFIVQLALFGEVVYG